MATVEEHQETTEKKAKKPKAAKEPKAKPVAGVWGLDVGQCALKAIRLELIDGQVTATAFDYVEYPKILSQPDADPDQLTREALEKFLSRNNLRGDQVVIGVPGQSGLARFVKLPPVEEKKITDIVRFEAKQQIPFPLEEVVWDYQRIGSGVVTDGFAMETEIGLFAMKRDMVNRSLQSFKDVDVEVHVVQMSPLALCNYVAYDLLNREGDKAPGADGESGDKAADFKKHCIVALDIGTDSSNLVITDGDRIIWQRPIPHGGNHFTRALTKELKLTFAKAEHVKRNATKSPDLKRILAALKPVLNDFVGEVQRSLGYFANTHRDAQVEYVIGLGNAFRMPGLQKFLSEKLQVDVRKLQKMARLQGDSVVTAPAFTQNIMSFAVAYGLALQGLGRTRLRTNLLPHDIRFERMIRAKKPWAVTAAAALLVGAVSMAFGYSMQYRAVASPVINDAIKQANGILGRVQGETQQVADRERKLQENENTVSSMVVGQRERVDWLLLNRFIDECLPCPGKLVQGGFGGRNAKGDGFLLVDDAGREHAIPNDSIVTPLENKWPEGKVPALADFPLGTRIEVLFQPDPTAKPFWNDAAQEAFRQYWNRLATGSDAKVDESGVRNLIHVDIEYVDARLSHDLATFWQGLQSRTDFHRGMQMIKDQDAVPSGQGWVVELRGYTYHDNPQRFLRETLLTNLSYRGAAAQAAAVKPGAAGATVPVPPLAVPPELQKDWNEKIQGKISHAVIFKTDIDKEAKVGEFKYRIIENSALAGLSGLTPLKSLLGTAGSGFDGDSHNKAAVKVSRKGSSAEGMEDALELAQKNARGPTSQKETLMRTEFIILFVWKEPIQG